MAMPELGKQPAGEYQRDGEIGSLVMSEPPAARSIHESEDIAHSS
jgi:hypothetical protein